MLSGAAEDGTGHRAGLAHVRLTSKDHTRRSGSRRSGSPWMTKAWLIDDELIAARDRTQIDPASTM